MVVSESTEINVDHLLDNEKVVTILSIDGGGLCGAIPAAVPVLQKFEKFLQKLDGDKVRIADYFDVIAGTGTGSIMAAMLTAPDEEEPLRPRYTAKEITTFLIEASEATFSDDSKIATKKINKLKEKVHPEKFKWYHFCSRICYLIRRALIHIDAQLFHPDFDGKSFKILLNKRLRQPKTETQSSDDNDVDDDDDDDDSKRKMGLDETLKDVIVPVFDLNKSRPFIFSTDKAKNHKQQMFGNVNLLDVVRSSTATPTLFPHHSFRYKGKKSCFADGNLVTQNPTLLALYEAARKHGSQPGYRNYLILSLGTGRPKIPEDTFEGLKCIKFCFERVITNTMEYTLLRR